MSSNEGHDHGHLDATTGREVVFCHACSAEWYRNNHGLRCPRCESEITEIVSPENDPRVIQDEPSLASSSTGERHFHPQRSFYGDNDSDPEEADIEEHMGHRGFDFNRNTRPGGHPQPHDPGIQTVMDQFVSMIQTLSPGQSIGRPRPMSPNSVNPSRQPNIHRTTHTFHNGPFGRGGTASVTFITGPPAMMGGGPRGEAVREEGEGGPPPGHGFGDPFEQIFSNVLHDIGAPHGQHDEADGAPPELARSLQELLGHVFNPINAVAGDAVYSQEALDRIISGLMEANPQSNAAPPASDDALSKLERRPVTKEMLTRDEKTDCSICLDDLKVGQVGVFLPCKHWFHEDCVVAWLKAHNTCPVCRNPIEKSEHGDRQRSDGHDDDDNSGGPRRRSQPGNDDNRNPRGFRYVPPGLPGGWPFGFANNNNPEGRSEEFQRQSYSFTFGPAVNHQTRPPMPSQSQSRLNEAMRSVSSMQQRQRAQARGDDDDEDEVSARGFSYDTSRMQRRTSMSPTSTRSGAREWQSSRHRQRSPSTRSRRVSYGSDGSGGQTQSSGPLNWLRDRFGSSGASSRDRRN